MADKTDTLSKIFEAYEHETGESIFDLAAKWRYETNEEMGLDEEDIIWEEAQKVADAERAARSHAKE